MAGFDSAVASTGNTVAAGTVGLVLGRLVINAAGNETLEVWLNPNVSNGITGLGTAAVSLSGQVASLDGGVTLLGISSYRSTGVAGVIDSIRMSNALDANHAFLDVTAVPEPGSAAIFGGAAALLMFARRRVC